MPERFGGVALGPATQSQTLALIATELARGDSGIADKLVQHWKISVLLGRFTPEHLQAHWFGRHA